MRIQVRSRGASSVKVRFTPGIPGLTPELQFNGSSNNIEYRYAGQGGSWTPVSGGNLDTLFGSYRTDAAASATAAAASKAGAATSETNAATSESNAATSETNAATSASNAATSETSAASSATLSQNWAEKTDGTVDGTGYSAKHWAQTAASVAVGDINASIVAFTPAGDVAATDVQSAIVELDTEKVPTTRTVAGKPLSADITLAKADVGLGNVDNTPDAEKPISTETQAALDGKRDKTDGAFNTFVQSYGTNGDNTQGTYWFGQTSNNRWVQNSGNKLTMNGMGLSINGQLGSWTTSGWAVNLQIKQGGGIHWLSNGQSAAWFLGVSGNSLYFMAGVDAVNGTGAASTYLQIGTGGYYVGGNPIIHTGNFTSYFTMRRTAYGQMGAYLSGQWIGGATGPSGTFLTSIMIDYNTSGAPYYGYYYYLQWAWNGVYYTIGG